MKAEVKLGKFRLAMPIGGLEKLAEENSLTAYPVEMFQALKLGMWKADELRAVIRVGLEMADDKQSAEDAEAQHTPGELRDAAVRLLEKALKDDSGNFGAAAFPKLIDSDSKLATTS